MSGRDVLVVLMSHARPQNVERVVAAWKGQSDPPAKVVVVDNVTDERLLLDRLHGPRQELYPAWEAQGADDVWRFTENLGCFSRIAVAAAYADHRYTVFADDDLVPGPDALRGLLDAARLLGDRFATLGQLGRRIDGGAGPGRRYVTRNVPRGPRPVPCDLTCRVHLCRSASLPHAVALRNELVERSDAGVGLTDQPLVEPGRAALDGGALTGCGPASPQGNVRVRELVKVHDDILLAFGAQTGRLGWPSYVIPTGPPERELIAADLDDRKGLWSRPGHAAERNLMVDLCWAAGWRSSVGAALVSGGR